MKWAIHHVTFPTHDAEASVLEGAFARGDRRLADVLEDRAREPDRTRIRSRRSLAHSRARSLASVHSRTFTKVVGSSSRGKSAVQPGGTAGSLRS